MDSRIKKELDDSNSKLELVREALHTKRKLVQSLKANIIKEETILIDLKIKEENLLEEIRRLEISLPI